MPISRPSVAAAGLLLALAWGTALAQSADDDPAPDAGEAAPAAEQRKQYKHHRHHGHYGRHRRGPTLAVETEGRGGRLSFRCHASMEACLDALDRVYAHQARRASGDD